MNSGSYLRAVFVFISGITTFTGLAGGSGFLGGGGGGTGSGFFTSTFTSGLSTLTGVSTVFFISLTSLISTCLATGLAAGALAAWSCGLFCFRR